MSSPSPDRSAWQAWLLLAACTVMFAWYAVPQLVYSLTFLYQLARAVLPGIIPEIIRP